MSILILGSKGMLGGALQKVFPDAIAWDKEDCDVTDEHIVQSKISALEHKPHAVVNCVAFNDVDGAETKQDIAFLLNTIVPGNVAKICKELGVPFVHFTSQLVFDGSQELCEESEVPHPVSVYGQSKYQGEQEVQKNTDTYYIIRTAVLFGPKGQSELSKKSFIDIMLEKSTQVDTLRVVEDEVSNITYVKDLAETVKLILDEARPYGIYHVTNSGFCSWYELAKEIFAITGKSMNVIPVPASEFPRAAVRPKKVVLINTKLPQLREWREALREFLQ